MTTKYEAGAQCIATEKLRWVIGSYESEPAAQEQAQRFAWAIRSDVESSTYTPRGSGVESYGAFLQSVARGDTIPESALEALVTPLLDDPFIRLVVDIKMGSPTRLHSAIELCAQMLQRHAKRTAEK